MILNNLSGVPRRMWRGGTTACLVLFFVTAGWGVEAGRESPASKVVVQTHLGPVSGIMCDDVHVFRGVPYAKPPVGDLRWRGPEDPASWTDVHPCEDFCPICPQPKMGLIGISAPLRRQTARPARRRCCDVQLPFGHVWIPGPRESNGGVAVSCFGPLWAVGPNPCVDLGADEHRSIWRRSSERNRLR